MTVMVFVFVFCVGAVHVAGGFRPVLVVYDILLKRGLIMMAMRWYVVHAYSGFEKSACKTLKERIERETYKTDLARFWCRLKKWST